MHSVFIFCKNSLAMFQIITRLTIRNCDTAICMCCILTYTIFIGSFLLDFIGNVNFSFKIFFKSCPGYLCIPWQTFLLYPAKHSHQHDWRISPDMLPPVYQDKMHESFYTNTKTLYTDISNPLFLCKAICSANFECPKIHFIFPGSSSIRSNEYKINSLPSSKFSFASLAISFFWWWTFRV